MWITGIHYVMKSIEVFELTVCGCCMVCDFYVVTIVWCVSCILCAVVAHYVIYMWSLLYGVLVAYCVWLFYSVWFLHGHFCMLCQGMLCVIATQCVPMLCVVVAQCVIYIWSVLRGLSHFCMWCVACGYCMVCDFYVVSIVCYVAYNIGLYYGLSEWCMIVTYCPMCNVMWGHVQRTVRVGYILRWRWSIISYYSVTLCMCEWCWVFSVWTVLYQFSIMSIPCFCWAVFIYISTYKYSNIDLIICTLSSPQLVVFWSMLHSLILQSTSMYVHTFSILIYMFCHDFIYEFHCALIPAANWSVAKGFLFHFWKHLTH